MTSTAAELLTTAASRRLLSLGLARLDVGDLALLARLAQAVRERRLAAAAAAADPEELAGEHEALFGSAGACPPYEADYEADPFRRTRQLADVAGFYRAFGAEAGGPAGERPDHAGCELEFLAFLALRRADCLERGDPEGARACAEAEGAFLRDHAGRWLPSFFRDLARAAGGPFHRALAEAGARQVAADLARWGMEASFLPRRAPAAEGDEIRCGPSCPPPALPGEGGQGG